MIKRQFFELALKYTSNKNLVNSLWEEINHQYQADFRHYHNLLHLNTFLLELMQVKSMIKSWDALVLALVYHDIIQDAGAGKNEKESAKLAKKRLAELDFPNDAVLLCEQAILSTGKHVKSESSDINYFTDADLYILGQSWTDYHQYMKDIRMEYSNVPDKLFYTGRKRILLDLLELPIIYKTVYFYEKYEKKARQNLENEIRSMP